MRCNKCSRCDYNFPVCSRCHCVAYCSKVCQTKDWFHHKQHCRKELHHRLQLLVEKECSLNNIPMDTIDQQMDFLPISISFSMWKYNAFPGSLKNQCIGCPTCGNNILMKGFWERIRQKYSWKDSWVEYIQCIPCEEKKYRLCTNTLMEEKQCRYAMFSAWIGLHLVLDNNRDVISLIFNAMKLLQHSCLEDITTISSYFSG